LLPKILLGSLFAVGLALAIISVVDAMAGEPFLGMPAGLVLVAGLLLMAAGLVGLDSIEVRQARRTWRRLADEMGLALRSEGSGHALGTYRGRHVHVHARRTDPLSSRFDDLETVVRVTLRVPVGDPFAIHVGPPGSHARERGSAMLEEIIPTAGQQRSYSVSGEQDLYTRALLASPRLRQQLARLREHSTIRASDSSLTLRQSEGQGLEGDATYLFFVLDLLSDLADALEKADPDRQEPKGTVARKGGE
jgi:hypothetical protein